MHHSTRPTDREYIPVETKETESLNDGSSDSEIFDARSRRHQGRNLSCCFASILPWILTVAFAVSTVILTAKLRAQSSFGTYQTNFKTDFAFPIKVPLEEIQFRGSPHFLKNGTPWIKDADETAPWPENVRYVGEPSHEIDENWQRLIGKRYFSISEEEAKRAWGDRRQEFVDQNMGGYTAGFDMFHTLHCINELRKALRPEYYPPKSHTLHGALHNGTYLDMRHTPLVQCYGSTTLIPTRFMEGLEHNYIDSDQRHVCRSFTAIRDFMDSRMPGGGRYVARDQSLLNERKHKIAKAWGEVNGDNEKGGAS
ncbi:uncharacterized protein FFFS_05530 [Fusarium fujikuroi]|nr:uncharacterized protein FFFS_05530 [Fusarium fujikuroi]